MQDLFQDEVIVTHIHNLRPFNYDEERTDPVVVAQQNAQEFVTEEVLAHRGDRAKRSTLEFWSFESVGPASVKKATIGSLTRL